MNSGSILSCYFNKSAVERQNTIFSNHGEVSSMN